MKQLSEFHGRGFPARFVGCDQSTETERENTSRLAKAPGELMLPFGRPLDYNGKMRQLTAIVHKGEPDEGGFWATCLEVPGANGQGETKEECLADLRDAIKLLVETEREEAFRLDPDAETADLVLA